MRLLNGFFQEFLYLSILFMPELLNPRLKRRAKLLIALVIAMNEVLRDFDLLNANDHPPDPAAQQRPKSRNSVRVNNGDIQ